MIIGGGWELFMVFVRNCVTYYLIIASIELNVNGN